jgi:hypothetical protein
MHYVRLGEFLSVSRITGPAHNLLQLKLLPSPAGELVCEQLARQGGCRHPPLDEESLIEFVLEGVELANRRLGTSYAVSHIRYVRDDTPPEAIYGFLATSLLEHLHRGGSFEPGTAPVRPPGEHPGSLR